MPTIDNRISLGNILTLISLAISAVWFFAETNKQISLAEIRIDNLRQMTKEAMAQEQTIRREAIAELRARLDADRAEIRQQLERLNHKLDELIKHGAKP